MPRLSDVAEGTATLTPFRYYVAPPAIHVHVESKSKLKRPPLKRAGIKLSEAEIRRACADRYPPLLSLDQAAQISGYQKTTLKKLLSQGRFANCVKRKKPVLFWRDRFIQELMQG